MFHISWFPLLVHLFFPSQVSLCKQHVTVDFLLRFCTFSVFINGLRKLKGRAESRACRSDAETEPVIHLLKTWPSSDFVHGCSSAPRKHTAEWPAALHKHSHVYCWTIYTEMANKQTRSRETANPGHGTRKQS